MSAAKGWRDRTPREESINEAHGLLRVARSLRTERQTDGDVRDNGDAATLAEVADHRRAAAAGTR